MATTLNPNSSVSELTQFPESIEEFLRGGFMTPTPAARIHSNLLESWDAFYLQVFIPGIDVSTLKIETVARKVEIRGQYHIAPIEGAHFLRRDLPTGEMYDAFHLPDEVDGDHADAAYKEGVLTIRLPKVAHLRHASIPIHTE